MGLKPLLELVTRDAAVSVRLMLVSLIAFVACADSPTRFDPLAPSKSDRAIEKRLTGHTLRWATERQYFTWVLDDGRYAFADSLNGKLRDSFEGQWWVRDPRFFFAREPGGIRSLPLEIRGESLYDVEIEVVLNGFRYEVE